MASRYCNLLLKQLRRVSGHQIRMESPRYVGQLFVRRLQRPSAGTFPLLSLFGWSMGGSKENKDEQKQPQEEVPVKVEEKSPRTILLETADTLYAELKIDELYQLLLPHKDSNDDEVLWRLARATVDKGKLADSKEKRKDCFFEAFSYIKQALEKNQNNSAVHKWYAILLDYTGECEGQKQRIKNSFDVKEHFLKAVELNPKDATSIHALGSWCYTIADLKWYERSFAATFYAKPPTSTFQEALKYFIQAEETEPNFYSMNLLMLGKTYMKLQDAKMAYQYLERCVDYPVKTPDDKKANEEARQLLRVLTAGAGRKTRS